MLARETTALIVIDVQGKLAHSVQNKLDLLQNIQTCIRGMQLLEVPIIWIEQYPQGLGTTVPEIAELLPDQQPLTKTTFSCCGSEGITRELQRLGRQQLLVCGIEAHVCVYQSVMDLLDRGYQVEVIADAVSSRSQQNREIGVQKMLAAGAGISSTEMCLFELTGDAQSAIFKSLLPLIK